MAAGNSAAAGSTLPLLRALTGGMKAWSLAWNTAELPLEDVALVQVRPTGPGCLSHLVASAANAAAIDAALDLGVYVGLADQCGWKIRYVLRYPCPRRPPLAVAVSRRSHGSRAVPAEAKPGSIPICAA